MPNLKTIAYVSSATQLLTAPQLEKLLVDARQFNSLQSVSGVLLYSDGNFMQYIEGLEDNLKAVYDRILASGQHTGVTKILDSTIPVRNFPSWTMGCARVSQSEFLRLATASWEAAAAEAEEVVQNPLGMNLLRGFWQRARKLA